MVTSGPGPGLWLWDFSGLAITTDFGLCGDRFVELFDFGLSPIDYAALGPSRITDPFRKDRILSLAAAFCEAMAEFEAQAIAVGNSLMLVNARGAILDLWGELLGLERTTAQEDAEYRNDLQGWWSYLTSKGNPETLITVLALLAYSIADAPTADIWLQEYYPGYVVLRFDGVCWDGTKLTNLLDSAAPGGVKVHLVHIPDPSTFRFDGDPGDDTGFDVGQFSELAHLI